MIALGIFLVLLSAGTLLELAAVLLAAVRGPP
jgi:hypothetical protein